MSRPDPLRVRVCACLVLLCALCRAAARPIRLLPLGDSITFGCGDGDSQSCRAAGEAVQCNLTASPCAPCAEGYRVRLWRLLEAARPGAYQFVGTVATPAGSFPGDANLHEGHPGWRTTDLMRLLPQVQAVAPDVVLLHIGTNDIGANRYPSPAAAAHATAQNLAALVRQILQAAPGCRVYLANIIAMPSRCHFYHNAANLTEQEEAYNARIPGLAEALGDRVTFVDMKGGSGLCLPDRAGCCPPLLHPNGAGYARMADVWFAALGH